MRVPTSPSDPILDDLLAGAEAAARKAAIPVMELFQTAQTVWEKVDGELIETRGESAKNPLTEADLAADRILAEELGALLPEAGWLSEETGDSPERLGRNAVWIVDPIDGTREYTEGVPEFAISIGLALRGEMVLGVLFNPAVDSIITGRAGGAVLRDGEPVPEPSSKPTVDGANLLASRTETRRGEFEPFKARMTVKEMGSTAWKLGLLACGVGDAYFTRKPRNEWDIAAGVLLCLEAGLAVTDLGRDRHVFNRPDPLLRGIVASAPGMHDELMSMIEAIGTLE
ncbi:MAG: 3'(2'),5'-bisphosphate nucleotidase CysQ [Proteobacteria bacterium]|nr:3'(2'),5'-bisphosphate nucleotidase CysQ [Pseudomonadota bacterium]